MSFLNSIFGSTPSVPAWSPVTLGGSQTQAVTANQALLPSAENLAAGVTGFNQAQLTQMLNQIMPGWSGGTATATAGAESMAAGQIPTDVAQTLQASDAAKALTGGFGGSGLAGNLTARDLGLTSLNLMETGQSELSNWTSLVDQMFAPGQFNVSSMFVSPQQEFTDTMQNQENQWNQQWLQSQVSAMPDPVVSGIFNLFTGMMKGGGSGSGGGGSL